MAATLQSIRLQFLDSVRGALWRRDAALLLLAILMFGLWPSADLWASAQFYDGSRAFSRDLLWAQLLYRGTSWMAVTVLLLLLAALARPLWQPQSQTRRTQRKAAFMLLALLLGPGLLVNEGFKEHWGRARPRDVSTFGGHASFTPAIEPSRECHSNCSFVSGHAAAGFALMAFAWVSTRRRLWIVIGISAGAAIGLARIAAGGHFLSDIVFSGLIVWFSLRGSALLFVRARAYRRRRERRRLTAPLPVLASAEFAG